jgi:hypothetical protein
MDPDELHVEQAGNGAWIVTDGEHVLASFTAY